MLWRRTWITAELLDPIRFDGTKFTPRKTNYMNNLQSWCRPVAVGTLLIATMALGLVVATAAETPKAPAAPAAVSGEPGTTTASFGDWVETCQRLPDGSKPLRICEVAEIIQVQGQQGPLAKIAIGRLSVDRPFNITAVLPTSVSFPSVVHLDAKDLGQELSWTRCTPGGCFAAAVLTDDNLKAWRSASETGKLTFQDASGRAIGIPISFRGLSQAMDALAKEQ